MEKVVVASSQQVKCIISLPHDIKVNTNCDVTMVLMTLLRQPAMWCHNDVAIDT